MAIVPPLKDYTTDGMQNDAQEAPKTTATFHEDQTVSFQGQRFEVMVAGPYPSEGDECSIVQADGIWWAINPAGKYPSRYPRPLADFAQSNPAGVFLRYVMRNNEKYRSYKSCIIRGYSGLKVSVDAPDGSMVVDGAFGDTVFTAPDIIMPGLYGLLHQPNQNAPWHLICAQEFEPWVGVSALPDISSMDMKGEAYLTLTAGPYYDDNASFTFSLSGPGSGLVSIDGASIAIMSQFRNWVVPDMHIEGLVKIGLTQSAKAPLDSGWYVDITIDGYPSGFDLRPASARIMLVAESE